MLMETAIKVELPARLLALLPLDIRFRAPDFAPYAFAGGGAVFGGGGREELIFASDGDVIGTSNHGSETKAVGQFGGGFEVRFTPAIGLMNDFSWNVVAGPKNNFGMVRSGITIAF